MKFSTPEELESILRKGDWLTNIIETINSISKFQPNLFVQFYTGLDNKDIELFIQNNYEGSLNLERIKEYQEETTISLLINFLIQKVLEQENEFEDEFFNNLETNIHKIKIIVERINLSIKIIEKVFHEKEFFIPHTLQLKNLFFMLKSYIPEYKPKEYTEEFIESKIDKRISPKTPTANERLKALKEFCPELITKLHKRTRKEQEQIIHLITGVNKTDAYKKIMTADSKELDNTTIKNDEIDFEGLKNKLKNT
jgi:hypothetical protein